MRARHDPVPLSAALLIHAVVLLLLLQRWGSSAAPGEPALLMPFEAAFEGNDLLSPPEPRGADLAETSLDSEAPFVFGESWEALPAIPDLPDLVIAAAPEPFPAFEVPSVSKKSEPVERRNVPENASNGASNRSGPGDPGSGSGSASVTSAPSLLRSPLPPYPADALRNKWTGVVLLKVQLSPAGEVAGVSLLRSSGYAVLDQAAIDGMKRWRFSPARTAQGVGIAATIEVPVRFRLGA